MLFPLGVEDATVNRLPWISIGIAGLCALAFVPTWLIPEDSDDRLEAGAREAVGYWEEHDYLELPQEFRDRVLGPDAAEEIARVRATGEHRSADPDTVGAEQARLDELCGALLRELSSQPMRRFALVPARGLAQLGWLSHMFLHAGWLHLLGNLFFFYRVGPLLEDVWGRPLFAGFYLAGGLFAALAHALLDLRSETMMVGASGAIAACMGAFAFRFATRRIKMFYFFWIMRIYSGIFWLPAWAWGLLWFGGEVWELLVTGPGAGVAFMAHVGGFGFGFAAALGMRSARIEERGLKGAVEATYTFREHPGITAGLAALERGESDAARRSFQDALRADPDAAGALLPLARLELAEGNARAGAALAERLLGRALTRNDEGAVIQAAEELGPTLELSLLRPALLFRVA